MEGSPEIKSKRRQFHQELQSSNMRADVKLSSVIVANPTHIAIGIRYERGETPLPVVTLKSHRCPGAAGTQDCRRGGDPGAATHPAAPCPLSGCPAQQLHSRRPD